MTLSRAGDACTGAAEGDRAAVEFYVVDGQAGAGLTAKAAD